MRDRVFAQIESGNVAADQIQSTKNAALEEVAQLYGVEKEVITAIPNNPESPGAPSTKEGQAAYVLALLSQTMKDSGLGPDSIQNPVAAIKELSNDFKSDGMINGADDGEPLSKELSLGGRDWTTSMTQAVQNLAQNEAATAFSSFDATQLGIDTFKSSPQSTMETVAATLQDPITLCHIPSNAPQSRVTKVVSKDASLDHLAHGDTLGACDSWAPISSVNAPSARRFQYATNVWTGTDMIVWGGDGSGNVNTGGIYNPAVDTWTPTSLVNAPEGRSYHSILWTGKNLIAWGGTNSCGYSSCHLNSGGIFNPSTNTWTPMSTVDAPMGRYAHTAVWTGSKMIVWGGTIGGTSTTNSGGVYDPKTDTWSPISNVDAPTARTGHTAVWTGKEMIVWGGLEEYGGQYVNTGGIYNLRTNTWRTLTLSNAPSPRHVHSALWTGNRMLIWGGWSSVDMINLSSGGLYDPVTDRWTETSSTGAPQDRHMHSAVWTGSKMIIWGGRRTVNAPGQNYGQSYDVNSGGIYDPRTDSWTSLSVTGAPRARWAHIAVWTGIEMLVFGGNSASANINSGGRFRP